MITMHIKHTVKYAMVRFEAGRVCFYDEDAKLLIEWRPTEPNEAILLETPGELELEMK